MILYQFYMLKTKIINGINLFTKHVNLFFFSFFVKEVIVAEPVTRAPLTTQSDAPVDCSTIKCVIGPEDCHDCCTLQHHKTGSCAKKGYYYFCQCQD